MNNASSPSPPRDVALGRERDRILKVYAERPKGDYEFLDLWSLRISCQRQMLLARQLRRLGMDSLADKQVLDVGCGDGRLLRLLNHLGAPPKNLCGVDINSNRIETASRLHPAIGFQTTDGGPLPFDDKRFDLVFQSTVFTSILSDEMKQSLASEMLRVCRPGGAIVWFDFRYDNPSNKAVRGVGAAEIRRLFPGCRLDLDTVGLLPPLARRLVGRWTWLAACLEALPPLRYAYLATIKKN